MVWIVRSKLSLLVACIMALLLLTCGAGRASAQLCPRASLGSDIQSAVQSHEGRLIYHDGIRHWFELKPDKPICGKPSIELSPAPDSSNWTRLAIFRGCRVRSRGPIDFSPTGYYSLDLYQDVRRLEPVGACVRKPPFHDYSHAKPDAHVRSYTVAMHVDYRPGDHPVVFHIRSSGRELRPWQAYASYMLTGGYALYGSCGKGFVVDRVYGTPEAQPLHFDFPRTPDDQAAFDPERAAELRKFDLHLGYSCVRLPTRH